MERRVLARVAGRLLPLLGLLYVIAYIDRSNVGFAKLELQDELGVGATAFTLGQVFFFTAYALLEVPSNLMLHKVGAHRWIARILFTWGLVTIATCLVQTTWQFYLARFALGAAEAGFFPGVLYYLSRWFPGSHRGRAIGAFMLAAPVSFIIGNPVMGALMDLHGTWGLDGWQWVFLATGVPAVLVSPLVLALLPAGPENVTWLSGQEKQWLARALDADRAGAGDQPHRTLGVLRDRRVLTAAVFFLAFPLSTYGLSFWLPTIIDGFGDLTTTQVGFVSAIPYVCVAVGLVVVPRLVARRDTPYLWTAVMLALTVAGFTVAALFSSPVVQMLGLCAAAVGGYAAQPAFWALIPRFLTGAAAAAGIAAVNAVGNLGGGFGPLGIAAVVDSTGSALTGLLFLLAVAVLGLLAVPLLRRALTAEPSVSADSVATATASQERQSA
ncbi:MFS transporter [Streptomyces sp. VRA16 Mangrove soil]|uniref:MFS transporter n=1 Tax=Streptomyces sp. VRA16 Mangrove soil TaxID=2817434 RepID=UPI001A9E3203|nr:MFS transporter [Streptomyces sp. VRA16 Mangrove soil]MBO1335450.1 MFS transporter [Streptomyces sp. VRA16 Mangrove soil]